MKLKISKQRFNEILSEELEKYRKIKQLESEKKQIQEALLKLENSNSEEELNELLGGLGKLFGAGTQKVGAGYQAAKNNVNQKLGQVQQSVKAGAQNIKQIYQQGEKERELKVAKQQIQNLWAKRQQIQAQLNQMQAKYQTLTGKKLGNQFQSKNPVAQQAQPAQQMPGQQSAAAE